MDDAGLTETTSDLSDNEGPLLAMLHRLGEATAYQLVRHYEASPVPSFNGSKGQVYPMIRRLRARGLVEGSSVAGDARGTERLHCTAAGAEAVRRWAMQLRPSHMLLEDPLRTKIQSFGLLTRAEREAWIDEARAMLTAKIGEVERYATTVEVPYQDMVHDHVLSAIRARLDWLDRLRERVAADDS